ncbi:high affinity immunoglobulin epsilon receptor subunit beta [Suncus etruscus]|uniref:high affinity immunoglobulin epsilon receptor subunit beta n=1 Tax=Suncus etruscus TaxID=109475 RepID=UPI00210F4756|nr:high affinity immunoglobulin epsilon receptor subunit beta [Suncus etruscus]
MSQPPDCPLRTHCEKKSPRLIYPFSSSLNSLVDFKMGEEIRSRKDIALPSLQEASDVIEHAEEPFQDNPLLEKPSKTPQSRPQRTWMTVLRNELEFLGVTQVMIALICLYFGTIICSVIKISELEKDIFSSFKVGYPFWGAVLFAISGILSIICEKKNELYLVWGRLGANSVSIIGSGAGIVLLCMNLRKSAASISGCKKAKQIDFCFLASFSTEIVAIILCLTILGFCCAVSLTVYGVGDMIKKSQIPEDRLYEEVNIYSSIYCELEDRENKQLTDSPPDS